MFGNKIIILEPKSGSKNILESQIKNNQQSQSSAEYLAEMPTNQKTSTSRFVRSLSNKLKKIEISFKS